MSSNISGPIQTSWPAAGTRAPGVHDLLAAVSRQRRIAMVAFAMIFGGTILFGLILSSRYEARMDILVEQAQLRRADPVMTGEANAQPIVNQQSARDETLNSEIAILTSQDVLRQVVAMCGLDNQVSYMDRIFRWHTRDERRAKAIDRLAGNLRVEVIKMSDVISVSYRSNDPQLAAKVLQTLGDVYLKQHALAHHPPGELEFFKKETEQARANLEHAEQKLVEFTQHGGVASGEIQLAGTLRRLNDAQALQGEMRTSIAGTIRRIKALEEQAKQIPSRQTTQLKSLDNGILLQQLKSSLLSLRLKRTELLTKYQPTFPLVVEVERQIAQAQDALTDAEQSQIQEKTTDRDPNHEQVREDLTRSRSELAGLEARSASLARESAADQSEAQWLHQQGVVQANLMRNAKAAEDGYLLLLHKQEEERISDQLDKRRIFNVSIVQAASVPALPVHSAPRYAVYSVFLGLVCAFLAAVCADRLDPSLHTQDDAELIMGAPVLVVLRLQPNGTRPDFPMIGWSQWQQSKAHSTSAASSELDNDSHKS